MKQLRILAIVGASISLLIPAQSLAAPTAAVRPVAPSVDFCLALPPDFQSALSLGSTEKIGPELRPYFIRRGPGCSPRQGTWSDRGEEFLSPVSVEFVPQAEEPAFSQRSVAEIYLEKLARRGKRNRTIGGAVSGAILTVMAVSSIVSQPMSRAATTEESRNVARISDIAGGALLGFGGLYSLLVKSPEEKALDDYLQEMERLKETGSDR